MNQWINTSPSDLSKPSGPLNTYIRHLDNPVIIDWFTNLILKVLPNKNPDLVRKNVSEKVDWLIQFEPFYLRTILESEHLSDGDKVGRYIGVKTDKDGWDRYPSDYDKSLYHQTRELWDKQGGKSN
jgi:hypothetical protein